MGRVVVRREDWLPRLELLIEQAQDKPFTWGQHDCCTFAADAVEAVTGENPLPDLRGSYDTRFGALRWLADRGFASLEDALDVFAGQRLQSPGLAGRGDLVLVRDMTVGVVDGTACRVACLNADGVGLVFLPTRYATAAWGR